MTKFWLGAVISVFSFQAVIAQDIVAKHDGAKLSGKVNYITESVVVFTPQGEKKSFKLGKAEVEKITYKSGRTEYVTPKIEINGREDWEKVSMTTNPLQVIGLSKKGEIKAKSDRQNQGLASFDTRALKKMKKDAADMHAHVILIKPYDGREETGSKNKMETLVVYGY